MKKDDSPNILDDKTAATRERILNCETKDESGLNDFQKLPEYSGIAIDRVGINRLHTPLLFEHEDGSIVNHDSVVSIYVHCEAGKTGINMSRLCEIFQDETDQQAITTAQLKHLLHRYRKDLRDDETDPVFESSDITIEFDYPMKQPTLKSGRWGWQYYPSKIFAREDSKGKLHVQLSIAYEYSSACPCSLSMSKQYEQEYADGKTREGNGIAVGHSQRSVAFVTAAFNPTSDYSIENLVHLLRKAIPTETQALAKRVDEQAFAILNGSEPMFVEHASRRLHEALNSDERIIDWVAKIEHRESLHSHNAAAVISKGVPGGLS